MESLQEKIYICFVCFIYWTVSICMVYLNKILMSNDAISIPAPIFITWFQCSMTSIICWIVGILGDRANSSTSQGGLGSYQRLAATENGEQPILQSRPSFFSQFPKAAYNTHTAVQIFPLSVVFVGMITFNNACLKYVEVSYYNVARSLTIVFNVIFSYLLLGVPTCRKTLGCLMVVIIGFFIGTKGELNFSLIGTSCGIASSIFVSLNSIFTKKILPLVDDNHWRLTFYNNVNACMIMAPLVYVFEGNYVLNHIGLLSSPMYWSAMVTAGFFGFLIGIVTVLQIKATSPLTHNFSGTAKAGVQSILAFYIWGNEATIHGVVGIFTVLSGSLLYTYVKMSESNHQGLHLMRSVSDVEMQGNSERS